MSKPEVSIPQMKIWIGATPQNVAYSFTIAEKGQLPHISLKFALSDLYLTLLKTFKAWKYDPWALSKDNIEQIAMTAFQYYFVPNKNLDGCHTLIHRQGF